MTKTKRTRKTKDSELATYEMMENLCDSQHRYITQRDKLFEHYRLANERLMNNNMRLQNRNLSLHTQNETQMNNFKLVAREALTMYQEMDRSGQFEDFLNEKISLNIEQLNKDCSNESEH